MTVAEDEDWHPNQFLYLPGDEQTELRVTKVDGERATLQVVDDYRNSSHSVWGINARNREQNFALNALMGPEIDFVTLLGTAGTEIGRAHVCTPVTNAQIVCRHVIEQTKQHIVQ